MSTGPILLIEVVLVLGATMAWCAWQLHQVRRDRRPGEPEGRDKEGAPPDEDVHDGGDPPQPPA